MTHGTFATVDQSQNLPEVPGRRRHDFTLWNFSDGPGRVYSVFPPFHVRLYKPLPYEDAENAQTGGIIATIGNAHLDLA